MLKKLPLEYQTWLAQMAEQTGVSAKAIIMASVYGTISYYRQHGTLCLVTAKAHECHGCRFLPKNHAVPYDGSAENVLTGPWPG